MNTYRISDVSTSVKIQADTISDAVERYLTKYNTGDMTEGETTHARVYVGRDLMKLETGIVITADGHGGVKRWDFTTIDERNIA